MKIRSKLTILLLSVALIPIVVISTMMFLSAKNSLITDVHDHLSTAAEIKANWLDSYFLDKKEDLHTLVETPAVIEALQKKSKTVPFLDEFAETHHFYDIFLISMEGKIFYTTKQESDYETNLKTGPYKDTNLGKLFKNIKDVKYGQVATSGIEYYEPSDKQAGFFAIPVYKDPHGHKKAPLGALVAQISLDQINGILLQRTGLGETGETLLAQRDKNGDAVFFTERRFGDSEKALPMIPKERLEVPMTQALLKNKAILDGSLDYRNEEVIAATRHLSEVDWGLVSKIDAWEAFQPIDSLRNTALIVGFLTFALLLVIGMFIANMQAKPIQLLTEASAAITKGKFDTPINTKGTDEVSLLAKAFAHMATVLKLKDKEKYEFITSASHQIRTPASGVRNALLLLEDELNKTAPNSEATSILADLIENNARVIKITNNLFKTLELGDSYLASNFKTLKLKEMVDQVMESFKETTTKKMLKLTVDIPAKIAIKGEEYRIKDVLLGIIENAVEYSSEGGQIIVKATAKDGKAFIEIRDTGIGIPQAEQIHLFEKFFRAKNAYVKNTVGSGLSLAIAKKIIEGHGGEIRFASQEDKGTTFIFTLPLA